MTLLTCPLLGEQAHAQATPRLAPQTGLPRVELTLPAPEQAWLQTRQVIRLGVAEQDHGPFSLVQNGKLKGVMADYLSIIANSLGLAVEVRVYSSWPNALQGLRSGDVDLLGLGSSYDAQRPDVVLSIPYTVNQPILVGRDNDTSPSPSSSRLATVEGYIPLANLQARFPEAQIQTYSTVHEMLHAVEYRHADWGVGDFVTVAYQIGLGELPSLHMRPLNLPNTGYSFVFRQQDPVLLAMFNRVISEIPLVTQSRIRAYWEDRVYIKTESEPLYSPEQLRWLATHPQIQVAVSGSRPPYSFFDDAGTYRGLVADVLDDISLRSGLRFNVIEKDTAQEVVNALKTGEAQMSAMLMTPAPQGLPVEPFATSTFALVGRQGSPLNNLEALRGKRVALTDGTPITPSLQQNYPDIVWVEKEHPLDSLLAVSKGRAEAAVVLLPVARSLINQERIKDLSVLTSLPTLRANLAFSVSQDNPLLFSVLETSQAQIEPRLLATSLSHWQDSRTDPEGVWERHEQRLRWMVLSAGAVIGMLLMWCFYLVYRRLQVRAEQGRQAFRSVLLDGLPQPVVMRDVSGVFLLCNDAFYSVFGLQPADVIGRKWEDVKRLDGVHAIDQKQAYRELLEANQSDVRLVNFSIDGVVRSYRQWAVPHKTVNGRCVGLLMGWIDMSDTERLLQQLYAVRDQAVQASEAKTRFLTVMSHEIRTPLNVIIGLLELTLARVDQGEGWDRSAIEVAHSSSSALMFLIGEILDLSKIESGKLILEPQRNNPKEIVETVGRVFHEVARQKGLYLILDLELACDRDALIDGIRLKQVLFNLLSNAIRFTDHGGVKVSLRVEQIGDDLSMEFVLQDTGIGISAENMKLLFQPFSQVRGPANSRGGTGLGLVICQQLVELMKGRLQLTSTLGQGTQITLTLTAPALDAATPEPGENSPASQKSALRILVVDDHPANRLLLWQQLAFLGHSVEEAEDGLQAFNRVKVKAFDVVFTDCNMPIMDGYELARLIREEERAKERPASLVVGFTANAQASERQRCLAAGMNDCLFKPVSLDMLRTCLNEVAAGNRPATTTLPAATPSPAVFDLVTFNSLTGGDPHLERLLLDSLYTTNCLDLEQFDKFLSARQWYELARLVHRIKGAARMVGAQVLIDAAKVYAQRESDESVEEELINSATQIRQAIVQLQEAVFEKLNLAGDQT
ncbi:transporter substrate-binding domain-containing protein [Pseudomonas sp. ITA]|uniref:ATP-binding protein n=1 Tax=Pseudomonas sp. ITA TaxID=2825841 RepID=UPI0024984A8A|nr:transporter substrate-binding domain-containing protein [Pseudomonas sp. ITA]MDI2145895.1 transporter substrate-binding domain-containing protein [Pseudomonas sp. ITA]